MSFASGAILFVIGADDKYLKSIKPITVIDARIDYINSRNRLLCLLLTHNFSRIYQTKGEHPFWCGISRDCTFTERVMLSRGH